MKKELTIRTKKRTELVDITPHARAFIEAGAVGDGVCVIYIPHTTACVCINENADPSVKNDIINALDKLIPAQWNYSHAEGNSAAHIKSSMIGSSRIVPFESGKLALGAWQGIYLCEFDGPRIRKIVLKILTS